MHAIIWREGILGKIGKYFIVLVAVVDSNTVRKTFLAGMEPGDGGKVGLFRTNIISK